LNNIYNNLSKYGHFKKSPSHGNLTFWAYQGCLLLNTTLTVQHKCPNGHEKYWTPFTDALIKFISDKTENIVFVLWGSYSLKKLDLIDQKKHKVLISSHPSGMSFNKPLKTYKPFSESDHFGQINKYLTSVGKSSILWQIS
jgi:uracil-DNA glycosylase